jgi:hypothetical protein
MSYLQSLFILPHTAFFHKSSNLHSFVVKIWLTRQKIVSLSLNNWWEIRYICTCAVFWEWSFFTAAVKSRFKPNPNLREESNRWRCSAPGLVGPAPFQGFLHYRCYILRNGQSSRLQCIFGYPLPQEHSRHLKDDFLEGPYAVQFGSIRVQLMHPTTSSYAPRV